MRRMERGVKLTSRALAQVALIWIKWSRGPDKRGSVDVENFLIVGDFYFAGAGGTKKTSASRALLHPHIRESAWHATSGQAHAYNASPVDNPLTRDRWFATVR